MAIRKANWGALHRANFGALRRGNFGSLSVGRTYRTTASQLALRSTPEVKTDNSNVIEWMPTNTLVEARSAEATNLFQEVTNLSDGKKGWAAEKYLVDIGDAQPGPPLPAGTFYVLTREGIGVNVRPTPSLALAPIGGLTDGTAVHTTGVNLNGFAQIDSPKAGWVASQFLTPTAGVVTSPANLPQGANIPPGANLPTLTPANLPTAPTPQPQTLPEVIIEGEPPRTATKGAIGATGILLIALAIGFVVARDKKRRKRAA